MAAVILTIYDNAQTGRVSVRLEHTEAGCPETPAAQLGRGLYDLLQRANQADLEAIVADQIPAGAVVSMADYLNGTVGQPPEFYERLQRMPAACAEGPTDV